jgi:hypothetical protein
MRVFTIGRMRATSLVQFADFCMAATRTRRMLRF